MDQSAMPPNCLEPRLDCLAISFLGQVKELLVRRGFTMDLGACDVYLLIGFGSCAAVLCILRRATRGLLSLADLVERRVLVGEGPSESQLQAAWLFPYLTVAYYLTMW
ncbi:hypothetical protein CSOJ01_06377 [Colletotrichum sojae]|uniref:Uncharacterized protein n=1 Tax=Colletotrichum sojae TaxID=2175907 RepID=A0A8H6JCY8_9PEZI|nr:hypothetical protein CSOJ01_06377 [Colletotrichum sojae]